MNEQVENSSRITKLWDKIGICASGLCLVHCLATPFLLILFPSSRLAFFDSHLFHEIFAIVVVSSILLAVIPNCRKHGHLDIILYSIAGVALVLSGILVHDLPEIVSHTFTILGSVSLITAHIKNMKVRHGKCESEDHACSSHA